MILNMELKVWFFNCFRDCCFSFVVDKLTDKRDGANGAK